MTITRLSSPPATPKQAPTAARAHGGLRSLAVDIGVPLASYYLLRKAGCDVVTWLSTVLLLASIGMAIVASSFFSVPVEKLVVAAAGKLKGRQ